LKQTFEILAPQKPNFTAEDVIALLLDRQDLAEINRSVKRKAKSI